MISGVSKWQTIYTGEIIWSLYLMGFLKIVLITGGTGLISGKVFGKWNYLRLNAERAVASSAKKRVNKKKKN